MLKMIAGAFLGSLILIAGLAITTMVGFGIISMIALHPVLFLLLIALYLDIKCTLRIARKYR